MTMTYVNRILTDGLAHLPTAEAALKYAQIIGVHSTSQEEARDAL